MENISRFFQRRQSVEDAADVIPPREHERVLQCCSDVPEQIPSFALAINAVGIANKTVWVLLPEGKIPFEADIRVSLPASARGIHMSRMEGAISKLYDTPFLDIGDYAVALSKLIAGKQVGSKAYVSINGKVPLVQKTPVSGQTSVDNVVVNAHASYDKEMKALPVVTVSAAVDHITACPCTQEYNRYLFRPQENIPMPTHSQRSTTRLTIQRSNGIPRLEEIISCLRSALHTTNDLLKRTDEAEMVLKSHLMPQFAEDTARETARAVGSILGNRLPGETLIEIESVSLESIHTHNVVCRISTTLADILRADG